MYGHINCALVYYFLTIAGLQDYPKGVEQQSLHVVPDPCTVCLGGHKLPHTVQRPPSEGEVRIYYYFIYQIYLFV